MFLEQKFRIQARRLVYRGVYCIYYLLSIIYHPTSYLLICSLHRNSLTGEKLLARLSQVQEHSIFIRIKNFDC